MFKLSGVNKGGLKYDMKSKILVIALAVAFILGSGMVLMPEAEAQDAPAGKFFLTDEAKDIPGEAASEDAALMNAYGIAREAPSAEGGAGASTAETLTATWPTIFYTSLSEPITITGNAHVTLWFSCDAPVTLLPWSGLDMGIDIALGKNGVEDEGTMGSWVPAPESSVFIPGEIYQVDIDLTTNGIEYAAGDTFEVWIIFWGGENAGPAPVLKYLTGGTEHASQISVPGLAPIGGGGGNIAFSCDSNEKSIHAGGSVTYDVAIANNGDAEETVAIATYNAPEGWTATLDKMQVTLAAGASDTVKLTVTAATDAEVGTVATIKVTGTYSGGGVSSIDTVSTVVGGDAQTYGAQLTASSTTGEADKEKTAEYTITVRNTGSAQDTIALGASSASGWNVAVSKAELSLAAAASGTVTLSVTVPKTAIEGDIDTTTLTATVGDGSTYTVSVQTTVKAGAGGDVKEKGGIPGFEVVALLGAVGVAALLVRRRK